MYEGLTLLADVKTGNRLGAANSIGTIVEDILRSYVVTGNGSVSACDQGTDETDSDAGVGG